MATATATQHTSAEVQQALFNRIAKLAPGASADAVSNWRKHIPGFCHRRTMVESQELRKPACRVDHHAPGLFAQLRVAV